MSCKSVSLFIAPFLALGLIWPLPGAAQLDRLKNAVEEVRGAVEGKQAASEAAGAGAQADAERIIALHEEHSGALEEIHGNSVIYYDNPDAAREGLATIEAAEAAAEKIRPVMKEIAQRYGRERGQITEAMDAAGVSVDQPNYMVAANAHDLFEFLEQLDDTRSASAQTIVDGAKARLNDLDDFAANIQQQRLAEAQEMIAIGQQIDPNHPDLNRLRVAVEDAASEKQAEQMARIDTAEWPGHVASFDGPGSIGDLSRSVHDYLSNDRDWGKREQKPQEVLSVAVRGPWQVAKRDILGQPVQWRLPVLVAVTDEELRPDGIARAYELSMVAMEGAANDAPKSPPWDGFWVGDNFFLHADRLP